MSSIFFSSSILQHLILILILSTSSAQYIPNELPLSAQQQLLVSFPASHVSISQPGAPLVKAQTMMQPAIGTKDQLRGKFLFLMYDPDGPSSTNHTVNPLHMMWTGLESVPAFSNSTLSLGSFQLSSPVSPIAPYVGPEPIPGPPHQYTLLVFSQPENFSLPLDQAYYTNANPKAPHSRYDFPILDFLQAAHLGYNATAATYFVEGQENSTTPNATATAATSGTSASGSSIASAITARATSGAMCGSKARDGALVKFIAGCVGGALLT